MAERVFYGDHIVKQPNGKYMAWVLIQDDCLPCSEKDTLAECQKDWLEACHTISGRSYKKIKDARNLPVYEKQTVEKIVEKYKRL